MRHVSSPGQHAATAAPEADERSLLAAAASGDRTAAGELVERTYPMVFAALYRLTGGDQELAADLTQDSYRKAWASLVRFDGRSKFSTWLYRIAHNTFLNHVRRPQRVVPMEDSHERTAVDPGNSGERELERRQDAVRLRRAVLDLPPELRLAVTARYWAEVPVREIARLEGITEPAVRKRLKRALRILGHAMEVAS
jgi:RNA polymerase sigma-70 factor (ECF subfamily)